VSPRPGGETDKLGNRYELDWAIRHALYCLRDDDRSLTFEPVDPDLAAGSEFAYTVGSRTEVHQLKRQVGNRNYWSIKTLAGLKIFEAAAAHVAAGREYHFVSLVPCGPLRELADRARKSADLTDFSQSWLNQELRAAFDEVSAGDALRSPQAAWTALRGMRFEVHDEQDVARVNGMLAESCLDGAAGHAASLALGDILLATLGQRLTRAGLVERLAERGITPLAEGSHASALDRVRAVTASWRGSVQRELLEPPIARAEAQQLLDALAVKRLGLVVGGAGGGKSAVLEQTAARLAAAGAEVLAFRLDRLGAFASTNDIGSQLGLDNSPAAALAMAADMRPAYLVLDQLDAVSLASGRMPESFDVVMDLIGEALSVSGVHVVLACRQFDVDNDHRIRALAARPDITTADVSLLPVADMEGAVAQMGLEPARLTASQRALLRTPLHLVLLQSISSQADALAFHSKGSLFDAFWERKRQTARARRSGVRFHEVIARLASKASDRQALSVPIEALDQDDLIDDANVLVSEHVLARQGDRIAFFHEAFFDYAFARQWASQSETLVEFLLKDEQELFRRAQVRQVLQHLAEREPDRFAVEAEAVLASPGIRFHIKATVVAVLADLPAPGSEECQLALRVASAAGPAFEHRFWQQLRRPQWLHGLHEEGVVAQWLDGPSPLLRQQALELMVGGVKEHADLVAGLLEARQTEPDFPEWLRWTVRFADLHDSRRIFDLLLAAVRQGVFDPASGEVWLAARDLPEKQPLWAVEVLTAWLVERPGALKLDDQGKVVGLCVYDHSAAELVRGAAVAVPLAFADAVVPHLRAVMAATALEPQDGSAVHDRHFSVRYPSAGQDERDLDDVLLAASVRALEELARTAPGLAEPILKSLAGDPHEASQYLLYRALTAAGPAFAEWACRLLLEGDGRLDCGYASDSNWVARELVVAIAPHLDSGQHQRLEDVFRDHRNRHEGRRRLGWSAFTLLSGLDECRLSPQGARRLGEYRRKFHLTAPPAPRPITAGFIGSPIEQDAAGKMTDDQWLRAMAKHDADKTDWDSFSGGARELSHELQRRAVSEPARFSRLALRMTPTTNPAYGDAVLMALGEAAVTDHDAPAVFDAVRHIASFGHTASDRWLGTALRQHYRAVPLDLVELVRDRAMASADPADDSPVFTVHGAGGRRARDLHVNGINTSRGSLAEALGDLLVYDPDGQRTELVRPHLEALAADPVLSVRACVAHTVAASLRHARPAAVAAFELLITADDTLLAADLVQQLMMYIGNVEPQVIDPVIPRMLGSDDDEARNAGGALAAFAALEWNRPELMPRALAGDVHVRTGAAAMCAGHLARTSNASLAAAALTRLAGDDDDSVLKAVAQVAPRLRDLPLRPFSGLLGDLIESPAYRHAATQLLLTLQHAPDRVDGLVLKAARRFLDVYDQDAADIRTAASADAHYVSELVVRGLAQSRDLTHRSALLDVLDRMLELGVYGVGEAIAASDRL
jgi:hypothetical protein